MERHIGTWYKENEKDKTEVGELVIDGNNIEFYSRFCDPVFLLHLSVATNNTVIRFLLMD